MRKIYFMVPNKKTTKKIVDELHTQGIDDQNIHVLAKRGTSLDNMPEANLMQKTDLMPAIIRGLVLGGIGGLVAGFLTRAFYDIGYGSGFYLGLIFAGSCIGFLAGSLVGLNVGNSRLKRFEAAIDNGEFLVLLDIPKEQIDKISKAITLHHPTVEYEGIEPIMPPVC